MWVGVQGWIQLSGKRQKTEAQTIVEEHLARSDEARGWVFATPGQSTYLLYARDIREQSLPSLKAVVERLAVVTPEDIDGDVAEGYFLIGDERGQSWLWTVRRQTVVVTDAPEQLRWLAERP